MTTRRTFVSLRMIPLTLVLALALPAGLAPGQRPVSPTRPLLPSAPPYTPYTPQGGADAPQQVPVGAGGVPAVTQPTGQPTPLVGMPPVPNPSAPGRPIRPLPGHQGPFGGATGVVAPPNPAPGLPAPPIGPTPPPGPPRVPGGEMRSPLGRATPVFGLPYAFERWENWWVLNRDRYLDVNRTFASRITVERSGDAFLGAPLEPNLGSPVFLNRVTVRRTLLPVLRRFLNHPTAALRGEAALALGKVGGAEDVHRLATLTRDSNRFVRQLALLGLGLSRDRQALPILHAFVASNRQQDADRAFAALGLAVVGDAESLQPLVSVLYRQGANRDLVASALYALGFVSHADATVVLTQYVRQGTNPGALRGVATVALGKRGDISLVPELLRLLKDPEVHVRRSAALGLGQFSYASALWARRDALLAKLKDWEETRTLSSDARRRLGDHVTHIERKAAAETHLFRRLERRAVKALAASLDRDRDAMTRHFAAIALGRIGSDLARAELASTMKRKSGMIAARGFISLALGIADAREAASMLRAGLAKKGLDPSTKGALALALGLMDDSTSGPTLVETALDRGDVGMRSSCAIGAALMDFRAARAPFLKAMATERNPSLRPTFGYALGLLGDRASLDVIEELVLDGKSSQTRIQGIRSLTAIRDIASVDILVKLLNRPRVNDITLAAALHGAGQIAEKSNLPGLEPLARDWNYVLPFEVINSAILR